MSEPSPQVPAHAGTPRARVPKFESIEGLRAWLAWMVVLSHLAQVTGITWLGAGPFFRSLGHLAVLVFVIVSGFVITHLLLEKPEPYGRYIVRRAMRILPVFLVTCAIGFFSLDVLASDLQSAGWAGASDQDNASLVAIAGADHAHLLPNAILHLTMLHGVLGNQALPQGAYAFNPPGWSLSLEWQFYIVAPLLVYALSKPKRWFAVFAVLALGELAYAEGLVGSFRNPSNIIGASGYFAVGISSRLLLPYAKSLSGHALIAVVAGLVCFLSWDIAPVAIWIAFLAGLAATELQEQSPGAIRIFSAVFREKIVTRAGQRSYSVYLCHMIVISILFHAWRLVLHDVGRSEMFVLLCCSVPACTLLLSEVLYRLVERPGMVLGSRMAAAFTPAIPNPSIGPAPAR